MLYVIAGIVGGIIGGMGMGGGTLLIPILTIMLDIPQKTAQAINLVSFIPMAAVTLVIHVKNKLVDKKSILYVCLPALFTTALSSIAVRYIDTVLLKKAFGVFLIVLGITFFTASVVKTIKNKRRPKTLTELNVTKDGQ
ncbi:MAG: sulfite exporter TauE/SafE family protein [Clostridia bacterium]|jgi:uncharacterized membrane protein YfcA|nr:sulfite exporter TauE/SafE family protein [Clostridia bacterium]